MTKKFLASLVLVFLFFIQPAFADGTDDKKKDQPPDQWGLNIWGFSYHPNDNSRYNDKNWGIGLRRYTRLEWKWFGNSENNNQIFFQVDALKNSYDGLLLPVSIGTEYAIKTFKDDFTLSFTGMLSLAYYRNPERDESEIKFGPVPGLSLGYNRIKVNISVVPKVAKLPVEVANVSATVIFSP